MLGVELPLNFNFPYFSTSIIEFWRRWHISLSSWLRDYLYIPLGGGRVTLPRIYFNSADDDGARRAMARGQLEFCDLGHLPRRAAVHKSLFQRVEAKSERLTALFRARPPCRLFAGP